MLAVDPDVFQPRRKKEAREKLSLPLEKKIIFVGAQSLRDERKGMKFLVEALHLFKRMLSNRGEISDNILVVLAGRDLQMEIDIPFPQKKIGFLDGDWMLAAAYQAADVFVCPSVEDAGPMMINESIMSGTPVVSFEMGAACDLVHTGRTGYRAKLEDTFDLAEGILRIIALENEEWMRMSDNCRALGEKLIHPQVQADAFNTLFETLNAERMARKG
jgi:glycosyltransferase involved in cell wall biosynthesis